MNKCGHCGTIFREDVPHNCDSKTYAAGPWQRDVESAPKNVRCLVLMDPSGGNGKNYNRIVQTAWLHPTLGWLDTLSAKSILHSTGYTVIAWAEVCPPKLEAS